MSPVKGVLCAKEEPHLLRALREQPWCVCRDPGRAGRSGHARGWVPGGLCRTEHAPRCVPGTGSAWGWHTQASPPSSSMDQGWDTGLLGRNGLALCFRKGLQFLEITALRFCMHDTHGDTPGLSPVLLGSPAQLPRQNGEFWLICCVVLSGWEGVWNWGACLGEDQRFFLVACDRRVPQSHGQAPGRVGHALGAVVWRREVLRGKRELRLCFGPAQNTLPCTFLPHSRGWLWGWMCSCSLPGLPSQC